MTARNYSEDFVYDKIDFVSLLLNATVQQSGGGSSSSSNSSRYVGVRFQRGRGVAGVVKRLRYAIPSFLESPVGKQVKQAAVSVVSDVVSGTSAADAIKRAGRQTIRNLTGLGIKNSRSSRKRTISTVSSVGKRSYFVPAP